MIEKFNYHWNYHVYQGVWHGYGLILEGIIRFEHEKSILFEFIKDKESHISYKIKGIVAEIGTSIFYDWRIYKGILWNNLEINEIRRVS